jgi:hypothetical protein
MTFTTLMPLPVTLVNIKLAQAQEKALTCEQTPDSTSSPQMFASIYQGTQTLSASLYWGTALRSLDCVFGVGRLCDQVHF